MLSIFAEAQGAAIASGDTPPSSPAFVAGAQGEELTVEQVMERALTAYGGKAELVKFKNDCFLKGKIKFCQDNDSTFLYQHVRKDDCWRTDIASQTENSAGDKAVRLDGFDGANCWQSDGRLSEYLSKNQAEWLAVQESLKPFLLSNWLESGCTFRLLGSTLFEQVPVWAVEFSRSNQPTAVIYLDRNNYFVIALAYRLSQPEDGKLVDVVWRYSEYRPALGSVWPFEATESIDDHELLHLSLSVCSTAGGVEHVFFDKPSDHTTRLDHQITVPFDYWQSEIVLKGELDGGEPLFFLLDTGTSGTIIDRHLAAQHVLAKGSAAKISGWQGEVSAQTTKIPRLKFGQLIINDIDAKIADLSKQSEKLDKNIAGIIGMNVISNYMLTIDYGKPSLTFADKLNGLKPVNANRVPLADLNDPVVNATFADSNIQALLMDTGAAENRLAPGVAQLYLTKDKVLKEHKQAAGLDGQIIELGSLNLDSLKVGPQIFRNVPFTYAVGSDKSSTIFGLEKTGVVGVLGNGFWQNFVVTLDMASQCLWLSPNPNVSKKLDMEKYIAAGDGALTMHRDFRLAEISYQKAHSIAGNLPEEGYQALVQGRLGNLRRVMAHDLHRAEHSQSAMNYFSRAHDLARKAKATEIDGRILADWSLLYSDNGQPIEAKQTIDNALLCAPEDANVIVDFAVQLFRAKRYSEMQFYIEKALRLDAKNWQALWYQVKLSEMFGDSQKEKATLAEIVKFYPWSQVAQSKLKALIDTKGGKSVPSAVKTFN